jgi:hypothetical protein
MTLTVAQELPHDQAPGSVIRRSQCEMNSLDLHTPQTCCLESRYPSFLSPFNNDACNDGFGGVKKKRAYGECSVVV